MNVHVSYRLHKTPAVEKDIQHQVEKLRKRLQVFRPELVHLKGTVEQNLPREGTSVSLNLRLPSGQMAVQAKASTAEAAIKSAFEDLLQQVNRHKELLRASHKWQRRGHEASERRVRQVPFEQTLAAVYPPVVSAEDVRSYVNVNLSRLEQIAEVYGVKLVQLWIPNFEFSDLEASKLNQAKEKVFDLETEIKAFQRKVILLYEKLHEQATKYNHAV